MKKIKFFSFASAVLLASAAGMTSCSSDSIEPTGGSGVAGQVVKTQFYLNIPYAGNDEGGNARVSTRMSDVNTQHTNNMATNFLGLVDLEMFAFEKAPSSGVTSTRTIRIGNNTGNTDNNHWRRLYSDIAIPVGTTNMVLYTRASKENSTSSTPKTKFQAGSLTNPYTTFTDEAKPTLSELKFNLETIHSANDFTEQGSTILNKLNAIAQTKATVGGTDIEWSKIDEASTGTPEEREILKKLYTNFVTLTAGSEKSVIRAIKDLKAAVETQQLADFRELTDAIRDKCTTTELNTGFPRNIYLPDGAAVLSFNSDSKTFTYEEIITGVTTGSNLVDHTKITYPSELAYFVSSPVKTSATLSELNQLPDYNAWLGKTADWTSYGEVVKSNTTLVVLKEPVQYGVACLESKIKCDKPSLEDNAKQIIKSTANNFLTVPEAGITVTGILVGGQPQGVEWNFEPASDAKFDHTIYDRDMNNGIAAKTTNYTNSNYTLVLDNKNSSTTNAAQSKVYVTVELENNMGDFYGAKGLIPKGSKFYLVGVLDPNGTTATKPSTSENIDRVFVKDHTTVANFIIKNLQNAYNHIPDLRTSKINVGLAVDLSWQKGITFNVEL
ncbi:hypothetical protein [Prevotella sp.]|uniref:hypothetical protein n=1 Tax=Prevotella sp. TaxID=59823 RepID=UPI0027E2F7A2|nr:hypothetical protein [Prevotella sp.]